MDAVDWMQTQAPPSFDDAMELRVRRVIRLATKGRSQAAKIIGGAINNTYEKSARELLEETSEKARTLGLTAAKQEEETATYLQILACEAALRIASRR